ncbi:MAG: hypothetical protein JW982_05950 [Spirochaetes bacterium]|nr:hypothetical protein [Spirochaetota bacterium]
MLDVPSHYIADYSTSAVAVTSMQLAAFYNAVGYDYYKNADYMNAGKYFSLAENTNSAHEISIYNQACISAINNKPEEAIIRLQHLKLLDTELSREKIEKSKTDTDFNNIRENPLFDFYMQHYIESPIAFIE